MDQPAELLALLGGAMILGLCCARDAQAWVGEALTSHLRVCDRVLFLDDCSRDATPDIARAIDGVECYRQARQWGRNEARDRNWLFAMAHRHNPAWCWWFDADETLYAGTREDILSVPPEVNALGSWLMNLWGDPQHYARDWSRAKSAVFRYIPEACLGYQWTGQGPYQIHCGGRPRVPAYLDEGRHVASPIQELHWGWMDRAAADMKLCRYRVWDNAYRTTPDYRKLECEPKSVRPLPPPGSPREPRT